MTLVNVHPNPRSATGIPLMSHSSTKLWTVPYPAVRGGPSTRPPFSRFFNHQILNFVIKKFRLVIAVKAFAVLCSEISIQIEIV